MDILDQVGNAFLADKTAASISAGVVSGILLISSFVAGLYKSIQSFVLDSTNSLSMNSFVVLAELLNLTLVVSTFSDPFLWKKKRAISNHVRQLTNNDYRKLITYQGCNFHEISMHDDFYTKFTHSHLQLRAVKTLPLHTYIRTEGIRI